MYQENGERKGVLIMANVFDNRVPGKIQIEFTGYALNHMTREKRNEYLAAIRDKIGSMLDDLRYSGNIIDGWYIELYEKEDPHK